MTDWSEDRTRAAYDALADTYAEHVRGTAPEQPLELALVDHFCSLLAPPREVLDAGCGAGRMLPHLAARGCRVQGVDLSPQMVRRARQDHPEHPVTVGSLTALPFEDASYDGVFCWYSLIHGADDDLAVMLSEVRRVLRPGGLALLAFQTGEGARDVAGAYRRFGHDVELLRFGRTLQRMREHAHAAGLVTVAAVERAAAGAEADGQAALVARSA